MTELRSLSLRLSNSRDFDGSVLAGLTELRSLSLRLPNSRDFDGSVLTSLTELRYLDLSVRGLTQAEFLASLLSSKSLRQIGLRGTRLTELPKFLLDFGLEIEEGDAPHSFSGSLTWSGSLIETPPAEVLRQGHQAIVDYFAAGEKRPLKEAKVLVVGEAEVGKTSLIKQLLGEPFDRSEPKTHDIARHAMQLPCGDKGEITLRVWDFGGQDIMHATHQFFLTRRSVYLLVLNSRQNETQWRLDYWLRLIESFGEDSPVIVVCNKCDEETMELPWQTYQQKYPQIKFYVKEVSCYHDLVSGTDKRRGVDEVRQRIAEVVADDLAHVGAPVPKTWFAVKEKLEQDTAKGKDYLPRKSFDRLCKKHGVLDGAEDTLLRFLHDLGVVLHYDDTHPLIAHRNRTFEETKVLNPAWVTAAIYRVLNDATLIHNYGVLPITELDRILRDVTGHKYEEEQQEFILGMMDQFDLCFAMPDTPHQWLIPDLLRKEHPDTGDWSGALRFRYEYTVLPGSVISRFIVRMHTFISKNTYWRYGVVLMRDGIRAKVQADLQDGVIDIALLGTSEGNSNLRREFLAVIRAEFERIHGSFSERFHVQEFAESTEHAGIFQNYQRLLKMERAGEESVWVDELDRKAPLAEFLDGVSLDRRTTTTTPAPMIEAGPPHAVQHARRTPLINASSATSETILPTPPDAPVPAKSKLSWQTWCIISAIVCGTILTAIIYLPARLNWVKVLLGTAIAVGSVLLTLNPARVWIRLFSGVITAAVTTNIVGFSIGAFWKSEAAEAGFQWDGTQAWPTTFLFAVLAICCLIGHAIDSRNAQSK